MRTVKLIKDVVIEEVLCDKMDSIECRFFNPFTMSNVYETNEVLATQSVERYVVPIKHWFNYKCCGKAPAGLCLAEGCPEGYSLEEDYIAMSPKIDETLGKYVGILVSEATKYRELADFEKAAKERGYAEISEARKEVGRLTIKVWDTEDKVNTASFWKRLKYLFTGRFDWQI